MMLIKRSEAEDNMTLPVFNRICLALCRELAVEGPEWMQTGQLEDM